MTVIDFLLPFDERKLVWYNGQLLQINDCLYRTAASHSRLTAFYDIDEILVPLKNTTGRDDIVSSIGSVFNANPSIASLQIAKRNFYSIPEDRPPIALQRIYALPNADQRTCCATKCIVRPSMIYMQNIHFAGALYSGSYVQTLLDINIAQLFHFNYGYGSLNESTHRLDYLPRLYQKVFMMNYNRVIDDIGIVRSKSNR
jgi:hypothetical protein